MIRIQFFFFLAFLGACATSSNVSSSESHSKKTLHLQEELRNIAVCYEEAVYFLQNEPAQLERVHLFLWEAKTKIEEKETSLEIKGDFSQLQWDPTQKSLFTYSGEPIHCRIVNQIQYLDEAGCYWQTTYRFSVPNRQEFADSTVQMMFPW